MDWNPTQVVRVLVLTWLAGIIVAVSAWTVTDRHKADGGLAMSATESHRDWSDVPSW